jgi:signal transduction histidine kinase
VKRGFLYGFPDLIRQSRRETALIGAAAAILLLLTGFSLWLTQRVLSDAETADRLNGYNARLTQFGQLLRTAESAHRGYLITQDSSFLQPYRQIKDRLLPMAEELQAAAPKAVEASGAIESIRQPLEAKIAEMEEVLALQNAGKRPEAVLRVKDGYGRRLTEQIEDAIRGVQEKQAALIGMNEAATARLQRSKLFVDSLGTILVLSFSFLSLWMLMRSNAAIRHAQEALATANADLEDTVEHRTAALKRANDEIQRFATIVSHDLRSPLVNIMGFTSELETLKQELFEKLAAANALAEADTLGKDFDEAFAFIKSSIARMDRLIAAILKISREGTRPLNPEPIDVKALVEGLVAGLAHQVREKGAEVTVGALPSIVTDRLALEQIFANLIENAVKFLKAGGGGRIGVEGSRKGADAVYIVSDDGRGVDPRDHRRIFELFRRAGPQDVPGEGMGLAYVSALVRRLGGSISVDSDVGRGAAFELTLPGSTDIARRMTP